MLRKLFKFLKLIGILSCISLLGIYISILFTIIPQVTKDSKTKSDAIIVLGARSYKNGNYNPCLVSRVKHGVNLYNKGFAKKLIFTGGNDSEDNANEAETMKKIAVEQKVASASILLEKKATSSYENLVLSKQIMEEEKLNSAIIVTEAFHSPRAGMIAKKLDMNYSLSPATNSECWTRWKFLSRYFLREPLAIMQYFIKGRI